MERQLDELIQDQLDLHGRISRMVENLKKTGSSNITAGAVQARLSTLETYWSRFKQHHKTLRSTHKDALDKHDYIKLDLPGTTEEAYIFQKGILLDYASHLQSLAQAAEPPTRVARTKAASPRNSLPRIQLPHFAGKFEDWPSFKDLFLSLIGREAQLSEVEKLHYLKVSLKGEAENLIKNLQTTAENYTRAWTILCSYYENKRLLVRSCISKFVSLQKMKAESASELRKILHGVASTVSSLESIGRPVTNNEDLLVHLCAELLDSRTRREWEHSIEESSDPPAFDTLKLFLERRLHTLEVMQPSKSDSVSGKPGEQTARARAHHAQKGGAGPGRCSLCKEDHFLMFCAKYRAKSASEKKQHIEESGLCQNCLAKHKPSDCTSKKSCLVCSKKHHTSLHDAFRKGAREESELKHALVAHSSMKSRISVLLATARVRVADRFGNLHAVMALVDPGSEITIITERLAQRLHLPRKSASVAVFGVGGHQSGVARGRVTLKVFSRLDDNCVSPSAFVLPQLTACATGTDIFACSWLHIEDLDLADPEFTSADPIDVLLGADVYSDILRDGLRKGKQFEPVAQSTIFGWVLSGQIDSRAGSENAATHHCSVGEPLSALVRKFWEQEEIPSSLPPLTREERECEELFVRTHSRSSDGRYIVRLPVSPALPDLSSTRAAAVRSLQHTERRFLKDEEFRRLYTDFMASYESLGHMVRIPDDAPRPDRICYLPHHGVIRETSSSTKLRVVFNGSWLTALGNSLNKYLLIGKNLLPALTSVILRWRWPRFVIATDAVKMYRQILVHPDDRDLQRILWRPENEERIVEFLLITLTYGLACAAFLAIRTLLQLAKDEGHKFPKGATALEEHTYMDDVLSGSDSIEETLQIQEQLILICKAGGFPLKKWTANDPRLLANIPEEDRAQIDEQAWTSQQDSHSMLGLRWNAASDHFSFVIKLPTEGPVTKRTILSQSAQIFDPLGWLTPVTIRAKISIQSAWLLGLDWDTPLPDHAAAAWSEFKAELPLLAEIKIPRALEKGSAASCRELHGFADASERAYAAVLYLKVNGDDGKQTISLIAAKSKVAPLKQVSLPRLELNAAWLLAQLVDYALSILDLKDVPCYLWSDSRVTLSWIQGHPSRWKTYVANRAAEIQRLVPDARWNHLPGHLNPADCASRGILPGDLVRHKLWWKGPPFLQQAQIPSVESLTPVLEEDLPEQGAQAMVGTVPPTPEEHALLKNNSELHKLLRITAWCRRWLPRNRSEEGPSETAARNSGPTPISAAEVDEAEKLWIRRTQAAYYRKEIAAVTNKSPLPSRSSLTKLSPFLDHEGILRVGGRIKHSLLSYNERHPIILPAHSRLTLLIVETHHRKSLHGGVQLTLNMVRHKYWIPQGRSLVKGCIHRCVTCAKWRAATSQQLMADLPQARVTPSRPFQYTGVDYAGPVLLRATPGRGHRTSKAFLVIFVCLSTRAVHLDVASNYSAEAFLAAFRRFVSRRGPCSQLFSDCGTNFVGADAELRRLFAAHSKANRTIARELSESRVQWRFNPPSAPHFGGLWEAAVKSVKHHLRRVLGNATLTYEEMATLLTQVEACLNSRPLCALSDDPEDLTSLTPGHFLVGSALTAIPEPSLLEISPARVSRWQQLQRMRDDFWARWSQEYLQSLLPRPKWQQPVEEYTPGRLCLIRNETTPPTRWPLARILTVHPGADGLVRVVTVKTATTELTRPVSKLILLPVAARDGLAATNSI